VAIYGFIDQEKKGKMMMGFKELYVAAIRIFFFFKDSNAPGPSEVF